MISIFKASLTTGLTSSTHVCITSMLDKFAILSQRFSKISVLVCIQRFMIFTKLGDTFLILEVCLLGQAVVTNRFRQLT